MVGIKQRDEVLEIPVQLAVGVDDVGPRSPVTSIVERPQEKELRLVGRVEDPPMHLAGSHVKDASGSELDAFEVDLVAPRATAAAHEQLELETLKATEFGATSPLDEARQRERLDGQPRCLRLVWNLDDLSIPRSRCRILVTQRTDSDIPLTVPFCFDG